jgi:hypothetical protein
MTSDMIGTYNTYGEAWNATEPSEAASLLAKSWAEDGVLFDPDNPEGVKGRDALVEYIMKSQIDMKGLDISDTAEPETLGNRLRTQWVARQEGADTYTGTDFIEFDSDGRISQVTMFYDSTPE